MSWSHKRCGLQTRVLGYKRWPGPRRLRSYEDNSSYESRCKLSDPSSFPIIFKSPKQNHPALPETIFEITDSPKEQRQGRQQQVLNDVHKQSAQVKVTELNNEEESTLEKDPGDNNGDNSKIEQTSNHNDSADDGSEECI